MRKLGMGKTAKNEGTKKKREIERKTENERISVKRETDSLS